jgi:hypothetical protein
MNFKKLKTKEHPCMGSKRRVKPTGLGYGRLRKNENE